MKWIYILSFFIFEEDSVLEGEGCGALLAAEATHDARDQLPLLQSHSIFFFNFNFFFFGCVGSSLLHAGLSLVVARGATVRCGARASHCGGLSCCGARALGVRASVVEACRL